MSTEQQDNDILFYGLSTCMWCRKTRALLDEKKVKYTGVYVNELEGDEREKARQEVRALNPSGSYPTLKICGKVVVGYHPEQIEEALKVCQPSVTS